MAKLFKKIKNFFFSIFTQISVRNNFEHGFVLFVVAMFIYDIRAIFTLKQFQVSLLPQLNLGFFDLSIFTQINDVNLYFIKYVIHETNEKF